RRRSATAVLLGLRPRRRNRAGPDADADVCTAERGPVGGNRLEGKRKAIRIRGEHQVPRAAVEGALWSNGVYAGSGSGYIPAGLDYGERAARGAAAAAPRREEAAGVRELLDAVVVLIRDVYVPARVHGDAERKVELPVPTAQDAPGCKEHAGVGELLDAVVAGVGD